MKKLLLLLLFPCIAQAAPFLTSDPDPAGSDKCVYQEGTQTPVETPVGLTGGCKADVGGFTAGTHNLQVWFKSTVWGVTSVKVPFQFTRPSATASGPPNLQLAP